MCVCVCRVGWGGVVGVERGQVRLGVILYHNDGVGEGRCNVKWNQLVWVQT